MSLDAVEVDCREIFALGQLAVAIGRAKTTKGLRVRNFIPKKHVIKPRREVVRFSEDCGATVLDNLSCCHREPCQSSYRPPHPRIFGEAGSAITTEIDYERNTTEEDLVNILPSLLEDEGGEHVSHMDNESSSDTDSSEESESFWAAMAEMTTEEPNTTPCAAPSVHFDVTGLPSELHIASQGHLQLLADKLTQEMDCIWTARPGKITSGVIKNFYTKFHSYSSNLEWVAPQFVYSIELLNFS